MFLDSTKSQKTMKVSLEKLNGPRDCGCNTVIREVGGISLLWRASLRKAE